MVSLCLTKAHIDSVGPTKKHAHKGPQNKIGMIESLDVDLVTSDLKNRTKQNCSKNIPSKAELGHNKIGLQSKMMDRESIIVANKPKENRQAFNVIQRNEQSLPINRSFDIKRKREIMLHTLSSIRGSVNGVRERDVISRQYRQRLPDARKDIYKVHKWRIKSGRPLDLNYKLVKDTLQQQNNQPGNNSLNRMHLPPLVQKSTEEHVYNKKSLLGNNNYNLPTVMEEREHRFKRNVGKKLDIGSKVTTMLGRLRHQMKQHNYVSQKSRDFDSRDNMMSVSSIESLRPKYNKLPPLNTSQKDFLSRNGLPPVLMQDQEQVNIKQVEVHNDKPRTVLKSKETQTNGVFQGKKSESRGTKGENAKSQIRNAVKKDDRKLSFKEETITKRIDSTASPGEYKTSSSMTMASLGTIHSSVKEGDTPTDSDISGGVSKLRRQKKVRLVKMDTRSSPQYFRTVKPARMEKLMLIWRTSSKLVIWFSRLWNEHRITVDDSYNVKHGSVRHNDHVTGATKHEVLFDVTDYKMKNQLRLSETTRRILTVSTDKRTEKDISLVQTALRNIKAISNYSTSVQKQIGKYGHFAGFEGKRVVVKEGKSPLNYYILLAGSAVVIKEDESGNTNPVLFLGRGDVFGEHELLEGINWRWSVVTLGYCEFLFLDKDSYRNIFITGGGGGLFTDPDRGGFLKSIPLLKRWPVELLITNPNRCLFRHFKRGTLLVSKNLNSEWIYVVKSGSCSVLKTLMIKPISQPAALQQLKLEQKFVPEFTASPHLVEKTNPVNSSDHIQLLNDKEEVEKEKAQNASIFQQLEMSSVLKELNADVVGNPVSSRADVGENDQRSDMPLSSSRTEEKYSISNLSGLPGHHNQVGDFNDGFRMSRNSDRHPPRTPSPMKSAYLRTGGGKEGRGTKRIKDDIAKVEIVVTAYPDATDLNMPNEQKATETSRKHAEIGDALFGFNTPSNDQTPDPELSKLSPVHMCVRQLTRGGTFGLGSELYADQPSLSLVSNGVECLMLNKKFYFENAPEDCLNYLREKEFPYPSDIEFLEQHWRLISWQAYQATIANELYAIFNDA